MSIPELRTTIVGLILTAYSTRRMQGGLDRRTVRLVVRLDQGPHFQFDFHYTLLFYRYC